MGILMPIFDNVNNSITELQSELAAEIFAEKNQQIFNRSILFIQTRMKLADQLVTASSIAQEISSSLGLAKNELASYAGNHNDGHFTNAENHVHHAVRLSTSIPQISPETGKEYMAAALETNDAAIDALNVKITTLEGSLSTLQTDSQTLIQSLQSDFNKLIEGTPEETGFKGKLTESLTKIEEQFNKELFGDGADKKGWVANAKEIETQLNSILLEGKNLGRIIGVGDLTKEQRQAEQLSLMQRVQHQCSNLLNWIGLGASVGGYQRRANVELISGTIWTFAIVGIFGGLIWFNKDAFEFFKNNLDTDKIYPFLLFRFVAAIPFVAFMTFAGFKAKHHRAMELKYRQFELELAAFEPNLASLPSDVRGFAKLMFVQKTFGNFDAVAIDQSLGLDDLKKLLTSTKENIEAVEELVKKYSPK
jgi:hypothetical protein